MNDMWAVRVQPSGATNSVPEGQRAAHVLAQKMAVTGGTTAAEVMHLEDGGWVMRCRYLPENFGADGKLLPGGGLGWVSEEWAPGRRDLEDWS